MSPFKQYDIPYLKTVGHREITPEERAEELEYLKSIRFKGHSALFGDVDFSNE